MAKVFRGLPSKDKAKRAVRELIIPENEEPIPMENYNLHLKGLLFELLRLYNNYGKMAEFSKVLVGAIERIENTIKKRDAKFMRREIPEDSVPPPVFPGIKAMPSPLRLYHELARLEDLYPDIIPHELEVLADNLKTTLIASGALHQSGNPYINSKQASSRILKSTMDTEELNQSIIDSEKRGAIIEE